MDWLREHYQEINRNDIGSPDRMQGTTFGTTVGGKSNFFWPSFESSITRCSFGCSELDDVLRGGLPAGRFYLIEGEPGTRKTTLAVQFVAEGIKRGEKVLYGTLSESRQELLAVARVHSLSMHGSAVLEVRPSSWVVNVQRGDENDGTMGGRCCETVVVPCSIKRFYVAEPSMHTLKLGENKSQSFLPWNGLRRLADLWGTWSGVAPDGRGLTLRDARSHEIYVLELQPT